MPLTKDVKDTITVNQTIRAIQSGLLGKGQFITVITGDTIRFTKGFALGIGYFPEHMVVLEEDLNRLDQRGFFVVEVLTERFEVPDEGKVEQMLIGGVKAGYYYQAMGKAKELRVEETLIERFYGNRMVLSKSRWFESDTVVTVDHVLNEQGHLVFVKTVREDVLYGNKGASTTCDGNLYPWDTRVTIGGDMGLTFGKPPIGVMSPSDWDNIRAWMEEDTPVDCEG